jgi:SulP family sulfate permease
MIALLAAHRDGLLVRANFVPNVVAGITVGIVAMPLAMAFAIASGATPAQGIYTAIIAGLTTSLLGGTRVQISGPTGAFIAVLAGITAHHGIGGLQVATLMAGVMLLLMGLARLGSVIKFIPNPVITGFTAGIAVIVWIGQWKYFFGLEPSRTGSHFHENLWALLQSFPRFDPATTTLAVITLVVLVAGGIWLKRVPGLRRIPAPLLAMVLATGIQAAARFPSVATIGSAFGGIPRSLPAFAWPDFPVGDALQLVGPAFAIALLGAIESLLTAVVADGMTGTRHDSNQELIGQGLANMLTPLFGGFAATGAIARTATNIRNGASSPVAGVTHALFLFLVILLLAPWAAHVPLAALAAILFFVAWNMADVRHVKRQLTIGAAADRLLLITTFVLTVFVDLVVAVNVGVVLAALLFVRRMAESVSVREQVFGGDQEAAQPVSTEQQVRLPRNVLVYRIEGPFFFGAAQMLGSALERLQFGVDTVVIRLGRVPFLDATGLQTLYEIVHRFRHRKIRVILCGLHADIGASLQAAGIRTAVGDENICSNMEEVARLLGGDRMSDRDSATGEKSARFPNDPV